MKYETNSINPVESTSSPASQSTASYIEETLKDVVAAVSEVLHAEAKLEKTVTVQYRITHNEIADDLIYETYWDAISDLMACDGVAQELDAICNEMDEPCTEEAWDYWCEQNVEEIAKEHGYKIEVVKK